MNIKDEIPELNFAQRDSVKAVAEYSNAIVRLIDAQTRHWEATDGASQDAQTQRIQLEYRRLQIEQDGRAQKQRTDMFALVVFSIVLAGTVWPMVW